jgi:hypothetical protein
MGASSPGGGTGTRRSPPYTEFDRVMPRHPVIRDALAQLNEGKKLAPLIANVQEGAAEVLYGLGAAGTSPGNELAGIVYLRLALHLAPEHGLALITLADSYESMKDCGAGGRNLQPPAQRLADAQERRHRDRRRP